MPVKIVLRYEFQDKKFKETTIVSLANLFHVKQLLKNVFDIKWEKEEDNTPNRHIDPPKFHKVSEGYNPDE